MHAPGWSIEQRDNPPGNLTFGRLTGKARAGIIMKWERHFWSLFTISGHAGREQNGLREAGTVEGREKAEMTRRVRELSTSGGT